jgi:hypothetical protein
MLHVKFLLFSLLLVEIKKKLFTITGTKDIYLNSPLEFLPDERESVSIAASCNDLLFCRAKHSIVCFTRILIIYVRNPFTMQRLLLPPAPVRKEKKIQIRLALFRIRL